MLIFFHLCSIEISDSRVYLFSITSCLNKNKRKTEILGRLRNEIRPVEFFFHSYSTISYHNVTVCVYDSH